MYCIHCDFEVEKLDFPDQKKWGTGELATWKHKHAKDPETGHPNCGKLLTDLDVSNTPPEA